MKKVLITVLVFVVILLSFGYKILNSAGFFREIEPTNTFGNLVAEINLPGVEDLARADSLVILSSDDRAARRDGKPVKSGLFLIDLSNQEFKPIDLTKDLNFPFFPHGISLFKLESGNFSLMAINHVEGKHSIEHFILSGKTLTHQKTITDPNFISPNDLVMVGPEEFYYSNDHGYSSNLGVFAENYLGLKASNVGFYDGGKAEIVTSNIAYANGIQYSPEEKILYVASVRGFMVKVYSADENWKLTHLEDVKTGTGVDNIELDETGNLWIGCHPNLLAFASYAAGKNPMSPSEIIRITRFQDSYQVESLWVTDGSDLSGSSVVLPFDDMIFIGNVMDEKVLVFKRNP